MKIEGSIQEIKDFIKEFQSKDTVFSKQQLKQLKDELQNTDIKLDGKKIAKETMPSTNQNITFSE